jgi:alpha-aminoadipic semialdehyde synthase
MELPDTNLFYDNLKNAIYERLGKSSHRVDAVEQLGLLTEDLVLKKDTPLDTLSHFLAKKLQLGELLFYF